MVGRGPFLSIIIEDKIVYFLNENVPKSERKLCRLRLSIRQRGWMTTTDHHPLVDLETTKILL